MGAVECGLIRYAYVAGGLGRVAHLCGDGGPGRDHQYRLPCVGSPFSGRGKEVFGLRAASGHGLGDGSQRRSSHPAPASSARANAYSGRPRPISSRTLCEDCKQRAITAERQAEHTEHGHQVQDQGVPEQKAGGSWLSRFRT